MGGDSVFATVSLGGKTYQVAILLIGHSIDGNHEQLKWLLMEGPRSGHSLTSKYQYQVKVKHCPPVTPEPDGGPRYRYQVLKTLSISIETLKVRHCDTVLEVGDLGINIEF